MALPLSTAGNSAATIDINVARQHLQASVRSSEGAVEFSSEHRHRLVQALQVTLQLETLLGIFYHEVAQIIDIAGLRFAHQKQNLQYSLGESGVHNCAYRLITQQDHLGEITLSRETRFNERELAVIEHTLSCLLCPLRNALTYQQALNAAMTDPLTGAGNRSALMDNLQRELAAARRYQHPLSVLVIDIDKFKSINDQFGHAAGDLVLTEMVRLIKHINRSSDACYRLGGEEFVVMLSNTPRRGAAIIAERLRQAIADMRICAEHGPLHVTASIGAATFCETDSVESLINRADQAMYKAKNGGGNDIVSF